MGVNGVGSRNFEKSVRHEDFELFSNKKKKIPFSSFAQNVSFRFLIGANFQFRKF